MDPVKLKRAFDSRKVLVKADITAETKAIEVEAKHSLKDLSQSDGAVVFFLTFGQTVSSNNP